MPRRSATRIALALGAFALGVVVAPRLPSRAQEAPPAGDTPHELLNATLWVQQSAEYQALCRQAYNTARLQLLYALEDRSRRAALEQTGDVAELTPAVVLDVDETVLDNSYYEARLIQRGTAYPTGWDAWVEEAAAPALPGAAEFCRFAAEQGVRVFYVTNRKAHLRVATRRNLERRGFPLDPDRETVLTRAEEKDKGPRRRAIAREHRILLLVGDNLGDFASGFDDDSNATRAALTAAHGDAWGRSWIVLPNPLYGKWEGNVLGNNWERPRAELLRDKRRALRTRPGRFY